MALALNSIRIFSFLNLKMAIVAPGRPPTILSLPILSSIVDSPSVHKHIMINSILIPFSTFDNTTCTCIIIKHCAIDSACNRPILIDFFHHVWLCCYISVIVYCVYFWICSSRTFACASFAVLAFDLWRASIAICVTLGQVSLTWRVSNIILFDPPKCTMRFPLSYQQ